MPEKKTSVASFSESIIMMLSSHIDYGSEAGGLISVKKFKAIEADIKSLMEMAWNDGFNACNCEQCDHCLDNGVDSFTRFYNNEYII